MLVTNLINKKSYYYPTINTLDDSKIIQIIKQYVPRNIPVRIDIPNMTYLSAWSNNQHILEPVQDKLFWRLVMRRCPKRNTQIIIQDIANKLDQLNYSIYQQKLEQTKKIQLQNFLSSLQNHPDIYKLYDARKNYIINTQKGGSLIYLMQKGVHEIFPEWISWLFDSILESIDVMLIVLTAIPGLNAIGGLTNLFNGIHLIYALLRLDPMMTIGSIAGFIPIIGQALGSSIKISGKLAKWLTQDSFTPTYSYSNEIPNMVNLGRIYGDDVVDTVKFLDTHGEQGELILRNIEKNGLDAYNSDRVLVQYGPEALKAMAFANKDHEGLETIIKYHKRFGGNTLKSIVTGDLTTQPYW